MSGKSNSAGASVSSAREFIRKSQRSAIRGLWHERCKEAMAYRRYSLKQKENEAMTTQPRVNPTRQKRALIKLPRFRLCLQTRATFASGLMFFPNTDDGCVVGR